MEVRAGTPSVAKRQKNGRNGSRRIVPHPWYHQEPEGIKLKAVAVYSGGMDSFTLLQTLNRTNFVEEVSAISFDYGQRHKRELECAAKVCTLHEIEHQIVDLSSLTPLLKGSSLTDDIEVPEGHYAQENMKATVVPNRNMIMASVAIGYAVSINADAIYMAVHAGDHDVYPDCRSEFIVALDAVAQIANYRPINVNAPFIADTKGGVLVHGARAGLIAAHYADTWTCYKGGDRACGRCGACVERLEAFDFVGWEDPLEYEDRDYWRQALDR